MEQPATSEVSPPMIPSTLWELLLHIIIGTGIFVVIALASVALDFLVVWLSNKGVSRLIILGLGFAEYFLFVVDLWLFLVFVFKTARRTLQRL